MFSHCVPCFTLPLTSLKLDYTVWRYSADFFVVHNLQQAKLKFTHYRALELAVYIVFYWLSLVLFGQKYFFVFYPVSLYKKYKVQYSRRRGMSFNRFVLWSSMKLSNHRPVVAMWYFIHRVIYFIYRQPTLIDTMRLLGQHSTSTVKHFASSKVVLVAGTSRVPLKSLHVMPEELAMVRVGGQNICQYNNTSTTRVGGANIHPSWWPGHRNPCTPRTLTRNSIEVSRQGKRAA